MTSQANLHTFPVVVGAGVTGLSAALTTDQLIKAAHGPDTKTHLAKAALGAVVTGAAFEYTKELAQPNSETTNCREHIHRRHSSHSAHNVRGLIAGPPAPANGSGVTVNVGAVGALPVPALPVSPDSVEEFTEESENESRIEHRHRDHEQHHCEHNRHHHHHHRHNSDDNTHHGRHLLEEAVGAYGAAKELLGDKKHHALHIIEGVIGARAAAKEARKA